MKCDTCGNPIEVCQDYATFYRAGSERGPLGSFEVMACHKLCGARPKGRQIGWVSDTRADVLSWPHDWREVYERGRASVQS